MSVRCGHCSTKSSPVGHDTVAQVRLCAERTKRAAQASYEAGPVVVQEAVTAPLRSNPVTFEEPVAATWNNTGGDVAVHLVPTGTPLLVDPTQEEVWTFTFQETTPMCGLGKYHGSWTYVPNIVPPLHLCRFCFPEGVL